MLQMLALGVGVLVDELGPGPAAVIRPTVTVDAPQPPAANFAIGIAGPR